MEWVETTGKTVEEAKDAALDQLGVDEHDAEFEIVEEPRPGLFGRMRGEARVRARVRPVQARPKVERRDRRRGGRTKAGGEAPETATAGASALDTEPGDTEPEAGPEAGEARPPASRSRGRSATGRSRGARSARSTPAEPTAGPTAVPTDGEEPTMTDDVTTADEQAEIIGEFLEGLVAAFGLQADISREAIDDETVEVRVDGEDLGLLVGPRGATLQAVGDLARTVVQRAAPGHHEGRVRVDIARYRERRREALERFTRQLAEGVLADGEPRALEPMGAADRKVVHDVVNTIDGLVTRSEGEDERRHVVIAPAD